jgi:outer membrane protein assembly factor BamD (BamD/ComL family)
MLPGLITLTTLLFNLLPELDAIHRRCLWCQHLIHADRRKPFLNEEEDALRLLRCIYASDPTGPLAPHALFCLGITALFRQDYCSAEKCFSLFLDNAAVKGHPKDPRVQRVLLVLIDVKYLGTHEPWNEARRLGEARSLTDKALQREDIPAVTKASLRETRMAIDLRLAEIALNVALAAERRSDWRGAREVYDSICRRYPETMAEEEARRRLERMHSKEQKRR